MTDNKKNINKKNKFTPGMNVGSSSILVTFVLLCLVTFAALSFVSASSDKKLTEQTGDRIRAYYEADSNAEINLANIDLLLTKHSKGVDEAEYFDGIEKLFSDNDRYTVVKENGNTYINYSVPVTDSQELKVSLRVIYPSHATSDTFIIEKWETVTTYVPDESPTIQEEKGGLLF